ncbi:MAG: hypothetical protein NZ866_00745 [Patescibacteria group bacterium]|nr:hypothetical protein [Patescibacteria group bacterium]
MKIIKKIFIILGAIVLISLIFLFSREYFVKKPEKTIPLEREETEIIQEEKNEQLSLQEQEEKTTLSETSTEVISKKPILLFDFPLLFPFINYPNVYAYDPQSKTIRAYNLEEKTYEELYQEENVSYALFSENENLFFVKLKNRFYLIDKLKDKKYSLPYFTQRVFFNKNIPYVFISSLSGNNYLAKFEEKEEKIIDVYILNPDIDFLEDGFLIAENLKFTFSSPLYFKNSKEIKVLVPPKSFLTFLSNKKDLIYVSYLDNTWKSFLIDKNGNYEKEFNFGTLKEKCTFNELLICGISRNQDYSQIENWYYLKNSFFDDLIIYNPLNNNFQVIKLDGDFDILQPQLTPLGIIFFNRLDAKLYLLTKDKFSF